MDDNLDWIIWLRFKSPETYQQGDDRLMKGHSQKNFVECYVKPIGQRIFTRGYVVGRSWADKIYFSNLPFFIFIHFFFYLFQICLLPYFFKFAFFLYIVDFILLW